MSVWLELAYPSITPSNSSNCSSSRVSPFISEVMAPLRRFCERGATNDGLEDDGGGTAATPKERIDVNGGGGGADIRGGSLGFDRDARGGVAIFPVSPRNLPIVNIGDSGTLLL